jgi:AraC-like DNA-binding protein
MARTVDPRAIQSILRALSLVEERLAQPIAVEDMARAAAYSLFHFSRLFTAGTGHAPYDYLMRRRVAAAAERVMDGAHSLTEIALECGFEGPDGFTRAFRRCFGDAPSEARRRGSYPRAVARLPIGRDMVEFLLGNGPPLPQRTDAGRRILVGLIVEIPALGPGITGPLCRRLGVDSFVAIRDHARDGSHVTFAGADSPGGAPPAYPLAQTMVPGGPHVRFELRGGAEIHSLIREFAFRCWLPARGVSKAPPYELLECGPSGPVALSIPVDIPCPDSPARDTGRPC